MAFSEQECIEFLQERGFGIIYKPMALIPNRDYGFEEMDVFDAAYKLQIYDKTNYTLQKFHK